MSDDILKYIDELGFENLSTIVSDEGDRLAMGNVFCRGKKIDGVIHWEESPKLDQLYTELHQYQIHTGITVGRLIWLCGLINVGELSVADHETLCDEVIQENPKLYQDYKKGKTGVINSMVGKVIAKTKKDNQTTNIIYKLIKEKTKLRMAVENRVMKKIKWLYGFTFNTTVDFFDIDVDGRVTWKRRFSKELDDIRKEIIIQIKSIQEKYSAVGLQKELFQFDDECWEDEHWPQKKIDAMMALVPGFTDMIAFREPFVYE